MDPFKRILCPLDFSDPSHEALKKATELASHFGSELLILHVIPAVPLPADPNYIFSAVDDYEDALHQDAEQRLAEVIAKQIPKGINCRPLVRHGDPASEIVLAAEEEKVDLLVISTHGHTGLNHLVFGSVAEKVVRHAHCPVLTIRASHA